MFDKKQLAAASKLQQKEITATRAFVEAMKFGEGNKLHSELAAQFDSIVKDLDTRQAVHSSVIPPSLLKLKEVLKPDSFNYILDGINRGVNLYRNQHGGDYPSAGLIASAIAQASYIHTEAKKSDTDNLLDKATAMGENAQKYFLDSVNSSAHSHIAEVPSLAMVVITTTIATALPVISYLPNPKGTQTVPLVYVRQVANMSRGHTQQNDYLDGVNAAGQYFDNVHKFKLTPTDADRKVWTVTARQKVNGATFVPDANSAVLPILAGATSINISGIHIAEDVATHANSSNKNQTVPLQAIATEFKIDSTDGISMVSGSTVTNTGVISITFNKSIPAGYDVFANVVGDYEARDSNNNPILKAPGSDIDLDYAQLSAYPIRAMYTVSVEALSQMQNELGVDHRAAFIAIVTSKLMLEQSVRLLRDAVQRAKGTKQLRRVDILRGSDNTVAYNGTSAIAAELIPAIEDVKRRIIAKTQTQPIGFDIYVTGSLSILVKSLADDTNFIPTSVSVGLPNAILRLGSRNNDNYYFIPEEAKVLSEAPVTIAGDEVLRSESLVIPRHDQAAKSQFIGHVAQPIMTGDYLAEEFVKGVQIYGRQAAQLNNNDRFGYQAWLVYVDNLPKTLSESV